MDKPALRRARGAAGMTEVRRTEAWLGKLLNFKRVRRPPRPPASERPAGELVIFTGVRYERGTPGLPSSGTSPARSKRKRV